MEIVYKKEAINHEYDLRDVYIVDNLRFLDYKEALKYFNKYNKK